MTYTLYQGDCLEVLSTLAAGSVDAVICDPPYGTTACAWDSVIPLTPMWEQLKRVIKPRGAVVLFAAQPFTSALVVSNLDWFKYEIIWRKSLPTDFLNAKNRPLRAHENILIFSQGTTANCSPNQMVYIPQMQPGAPYVKQDRQDKRVGAWEKGNRTPLELRRNVNNGERFPNSVVEFSNNNHGSQHSTQKPLDLMRYLVRTYTNPGDTVLDFTMGSGSTGVAAIMEGRNFIGIELDARYYRIAERRIANAQPPLFVADAPAVPEPEQSFMFSQEAHP